MTEQEWQRLAGELHRSSDDARPRADCPPAEHIWDAVRLALPRNDRLAVLDHTLDCAACAEAWRIALAVADNTAAHGRQPSWADQLRSRAAGRPIRVGAAVLATAAALYLVVRVVTPSIAPGMTPAVPERPPLLSLSDAGGTTTLAADGTLRTPTQLTPADELRIKNALIERRVAVSAQLAELNVRGGTLMGVVGGAKFTLDAPVATTVDTDRPTFAWSALLGAISYEVTVSDIAAGYREVLSSPQVRETAWTSTASLPRGRTYGWQVVARTKDGEVKAPSARDGEARFHVLPLDISQALATARAEHGQNHLLLGILYANAGMVDAADAEFRALAAANPTSSVVRDLRRSVSEALSQRK